MKPEPAKNSEELIDRFGRDITELFDQVLVQTQWRITTSDFKSDKAFQKYLNSIPEAERLIAVAESSLRTFIHDLMSHFDGSDDFVIIGKIEGGEQFDLRSLCPDMLKGHQFDWLDEFSSREDIEGKIMEKQRLEEGPYRRNRDVK